ncbi:hypothetical protein LJR098_002667 [Rhizobium sp. LjRoot98]
MTLTNLARNIGEDLVYGDSRTVHAKLALALFYHLAGDGPIVKRS